MNTTMKKCFALILTLMISSIHFGSIANAEAVNFLVGDYFQIGQYNAVSLVWRYMGDDANGKLFVSDKIICIKRYSSPHPNENYFRDENWEPTNYWNVSTIRAWLNSTAGPGKVVWLDNNPPDAFQRHSDPGYSDEAGFLSDSNFLQSERSLMKSVTQWTLLPMNKVSLSENGLQKSYSPIKEWKVGSSAHDDPIVTYWDISELPNAYYGAAFQSNDTIFLLDELQLYTIWGNFGSVDVDYITGLNLDTVNDNQVGRYILRGGFTSWFGNRYNDGGASIPFGIRPAFYLNEAAVGEFTGSGTINDPYILAQNPEYISVLKNGKPISFDVVPIMQNDRVLVPFRAIFEAFGAKVGWDGSTTTVTATKGNTTLTLQIGSDKMTVNDKTITLDVPPQIVGSRTLVPIRAVSEGLGANVRWDDANKTVEITTTK